MPADFAAFCRDPLCSSIRATFGLKPRRRPAGSHRATPLSIGGKEGAAARLSHLIDVAKAREQAIQRALMAGYTVRNLQTGFPVFAFRLHQFIGRGDTVYASLDAPDTRYITTQKQHFVPHDRTRVLLPVAFCRECGQEYYTVFRHEGGQPRQLAFTARELNDMQAGEDKTPGSFTPAMRVPGPTTRSTPSTACPRTGSRSAGDLLKVKPASKKAAAECILSTARGMVHTAGRHVHFVPTPFAFCLHCGVTYSSRQRSDYGKLSVLSSEGRSTATTVLSLSTLQSLRSDESLKPDARKLLSFTDNRQDASLQAGHFNDFVEVGMLRAALYQAVANHGEAGIAHEVLAQQVFSAMTLPLTEFAKDAEVSLPARAPTRRALAR